MSQEPELAFRRALRRTEEQWTYGKGSRTFVEVTDLGGATSAARCLGVSKSIVSRSLAGLEEDLDIQLLSRTARGAALPGAGATCRDHAARACGQRAPFWTPFDNRKRQPSPYRSPEIARSAPQAAKAGLATHLLAAYGSAGSEIRSFSVDASGA